MQKQYSPKNNRNQGPSGLNKSLHNSRSRISQHKKIKAVNNQEFDLDDNIRMINESMIELQDPKFISEEID